METEIGEGSAPSLGVVIVTFNSADVIVGCLESLFGSKGADLRVVIVDNASTDDTVDRIRDWASGHIDIRPSEAELPFELGEVSKPVTLQEGGTGDAALTLMRSDFNSGFAGGVNQGLNRLQSQPGIDRFWVLNPDCIVAPDTARRFAEHPAPDSGFAMMGGRIVYAQPPYRIQIDGGTINWYTGVTGNIGKDRIDAETPPPSPRATDFVSGASLVVSRKFLERVGPMKEDYFLYYEEVDWAMRRGNLPLLYCEGAKVYHYAGSSIGSPTSGKMASPLSLYFKVRGRLIFLRRHSVRSIPIAYLHGFLKAAHCLLKGYPKQAWAVFCAINGLYPPLSVRKRLSDDAFWHTFG